MKGTQSNKFSFFYLNFKKRSMNHCLSGRGVHDPSTSTLSTECYVHSLTLIKQLLQCNYLLNNATMCIRFYPKTSDECEVDCLFKRK